MQLALKLCTAMQDALRKVGPEALGLTKEEFQQADDGLSIQMNWDKTGIANAELATRNSCYTACINRDAASLQLAIANAIKDQECGSSGP